METAREILDVWMEGLNNGATDKVLGLYSEHASLIPTFSARTFGTREAIRKYFVNLGERPGLSVSVHGKTVLEQVVHGSVRVLSGIYTFRFELDEQLLTFEARFTFVVDLAQAAPILHHHSSQIPRTLT